jgi:uncharacterized membrane protein
MAGSATPQRSSSVRRKKPPLPKSGAKGKAAKEVVRAATPGVDSHLPVPKGLARAVAKKAFGAVARKTAEMGGDAIRNAADRAAVASRKALEAADNHRLPIQLSIDVAVPIHVAWQEWISWGSLPEGVHRIEGVERDGESLVGRIAGPRGVDWEAEIKDEREDESFAWRSVAGTDVAGLATFHHISERLTRIELDLDVVPTNPSEALTLATHLAHRHAAADLRRFKAHVEFINPDVYDDGSEQNGSTQNGGGQQGNRRKSSEGRKTSNRQTGGSSRPSSGKGKRSARNS